MTTQELKSRLKFTIDNWSIIIDILICFITHGIALFFYLYWFVNVKNTSKWLWILLIIWIVCTSGNVFYRKVYFPAKFMFLLLILICCFLLTFAIDWASLGVLFPSLLIYMGGVLLFLIITICLPQHLFERIVVSTLMERKEWYVDKADNQFNEEFLNDESRQGKTPEVQSEGVALPP